MSELLNKIILTEGEKNLIFEALKGMHYEATGSTEYIHALRKIAYQKFPDKILNLFNLAHHNEVPHVCIENLPTSEILRIPFQNEIGKNGFLSENIILSFASLVGEPYAISAEGKEVVNNLIPYKETRNDYTGLGSAVELDFHIENSALNFLFKQDNLSPSALFLLGIASNENNPVKTKFADARLALKQLSKQCIQTLKGDNYIISVPYRWREYLPSQKLFTDPVPIVAGHLESPRIFAAFYSNIMKPVSQEAQIALDNFKNELVKISSHAVLTAGKLLYINNKYTLHAREAFTPIYSPDGRGDRWVQRVFTSKDISGFSRIKNLYGRIYEPSYCHE
jgi:hypothetical protein